MSGKVNRLAFDDVDRFREHLWGWDVEPTQLTAGPLRVLWDTIDYADMTISRLRLNQVIADRMALQPDKFVFVICLAQKTFCGISVPQGSLVVFGPGREYRSLLQRGWDSFEITVARTLLHERHLHFADATPSDLAPERCVIPLNGALVAAFRAWADSLITPRHLLADLIDGEDWAACIREGTLRLLELALEPLHHRDAQTNCVERVKGYELTRQALDLIYGQAHELLTIRDLSRALCCTDRALEYAFRAALGVSPSQFILARRLHATRRLLVTGQNSGLTVTRAATENYFYHLGRFAHHYQRMFGELPSVTLRNGNAILRRNGFPSVAST